MKFLIVKYDSENNPTFFKGFEYIRIKGYAITRNAIWGYAPLRFDTFEIGKEDIAEIASSITYDEKMQVYWEKEKEEC